MITTADYTTISIKRDTKRKLEYLGNKGEDWDSLLNKLGNHFIECKKKKE